MYGKKKFYQSKCIIYFDVQDEIWESEKKKAVTKALKPMIYISLFHDVCCFSFVLSQTSLLLTKFIVKCANVYGIVLVSLNPTSNMT